jgi:hypothetical protein
MHDFFNWLFEYSPFSMVFPITMAIIRRRYLRNELQFIGWFLALGALGEILSQVTARLHMPNLYILHMYTIIEFNIIALFYLRFFGDFYPRWLVPGLMVCFTVFAILNSIFLQPITGFNTYARGTVGVLTIMLALLCFYKMLIELRTKRLDQHPVFWINTGFLLYFSGNLFFFILNNALLKEPNQSLSFMSWGLSSLLMALLYLFIGVGLWFSPRLQ